MPMLPIDRVKPNPYNLRSRVNEERLRELENSIETYGQIEPIMVRRAGEEFEIIYGYRRWLACKMALKKEIMAIIQEGVEDKDVVIQSLLENLHSEDLSAIDEARGYKFLTEESKLSTYDIAQITGKSEPHVIQTLGLLKLPEEVQELVEGIRKIGFIKTTEQKQAKLGLSPGDAKLFSMVKTLKPTTAIRIQEKVKDSEKQKEVAEAVIRYKLTGEQTVKLIESLEKLEKGEVVEVHPWRIEPATPIREAISKITTELKKRTYKLPVIGELYDDLYYCHARLVFKNMPNFPKDLDEFALDCLRLGIGVWRLREEQLRQSKQT